MLRKCQEHHLTTRAATPEVPNYISGLTSGVINISASDHDLLHSSQLFWYRVGFEVCWKPFQVLVLKFETVGLAVKKWLHLIGGTSQRLGFSKQEWLKFKCFYPWFGIYSLDFNRGFWIQSNQRKWEERAKFWKKSTFGDLGSSRVSHPAPKSKWGGEPGWVVRVELSWDEMISRVPN